MGYSSQNGGNIASVIFLSEKIPSKTLAFEQGFFVHIGVHDSQFFS
jgi:hypothetical protein